MPRARLALHVLAGAVALTAPRARAVAQHAAHGGGAHASPARVMAWAGALPVLTRATPTVGGVSRTEGYVVHPVLGAHGAAWGDRLTAVATLNLEGTTLARGELATGVYGEGYVDRRHPHAYVHELLLGSEHRVGPVHLSAAAGRGFATFGSDDPMVRPFVKYPVNHHLAQVLERLVLAGAARVGRVAIEASTFNGDEPEGPGALPESRRFGDSWAVRLTVDAPLPAWEQVEWSASYADVRSPEHRLGLGLDQRKWHASARLAGGTAWRRYALVEWMRTEEWDDGARSFAYHSALGEAALCRGMIWAAARLERTQRPEEQRLVDRYRTPVPHAGDAIIGRTEWTTATVAVGADRLGVGALRVAPFLEAAVLRPRQVGGRAAFVPESFYGARRLALLSAGARLQLGGAHHRMGRYGAAQSRSSGGAGHAGAAHAGSLTPAPIASSCS